MIVFSIESSHKRGMGHLFRSIRVSKFLGYKSLFLINRHNQSIEILKKNKINFKTIKKKKDIQYKKLVRKFDIKMWINDKLKTTLAEGKKISSLVPFVTFDDWGKGSKFSNLNIAPLYFSKKKLSGNKVISGINFLPLESKYSKLRYQRKKIKKILISMGGSDTHNVTIKILKYFMKKKIQSTVICGPASKLKKHIQKYKNFSKIKFNVKNIFKEYSKHDLLICGGGITPFEAASMGLPSITIANESFEIPVCSKLQNLGVSIYLGHHKEIDFDLLNFNLNIKKMSSNCLNRIKFEGLKNIKKNIDFLINSN